MTKWFKALDILSGYRDMWVRVPDLAKAAGASRTYILSRLTAEPPPGCQITSHPVKYRGRELPCTWIIVTDHQKLRQYLQTLGEEGQGYEN